MTAPTPMVGFALAAALADMGAVQANDRFSIPGTVLEVLGRLPDNAVDVAVMSPNTGGVFPGGDSQEEVRAGHLAAFREAQRIATNAVFWHHAFHDGPTNSALVTPVGFEVQAHGDLEMDLSEVLVLQSNAPRPPSQRRRRTLDQVFVYTAPGYRLEPDQDDTIVQVAPNRDHPMWGTRPAVALHCLGDRGVRSALIPWLPPAALDAYTGPACVVSVPEIR